MSKVSTELLKKIFPATPTGKLSRFVAPFNSILPKYGITTKKRFAAFIANVGIESDRLKALEEYASGRAYEGRVGLGNVREGDGVRYKGRSILQTTGRYNYWRVVVAYLRVITGKDWSSKLANSNFDAYLKTDEYSALLKEADKYNVNFLANPELLEKFPHAVEAAGVFVEDNNLNNYADKGQFFAYAGVLNTGSARRKAMHYSDRLALYEKAMDVIPDNFNLDSDEEDVAPAPKPETPSDGQETPTKGTVNVEVTEGGGVTVATTSTEPLVKEKVAIVRTKPPGFFTQLWAKVTGAITGNTFVLWLQEKGESVLNIGLSKEFWIGVSIIVGVGTLIWLVSEVIKSIQRRKKDKELEALLIKENSTPTNFVQVIDELDTDLYKLKGYKVITSGNPTQ